MASIRTGQLSEFRCESRGRTIGNLVYFEGAPNIYIYIPNGHLVTSFPFTVTFGITLDWHYIGVTFGVTLPNREFHPKFLRVHASSNNAQ